MKFLNFERLKTIVRFADIIDAPIALSGEGEVPYEGHEGDQIVVSDDGITITFEKRNYDIVGFIPGSMDDDQTLLSFPFAVRVEFPAGLGNSVATFGAAPSGETVINFKKNGVQFATCTFLSGETAGTFSAASDTVFSKGDVLTVIAPATADSLAEDFGFTLDGYKKV